MIRTVADLHTHTSACPHGHCTRGELIRYARERGLYALGISEHVQAYPDGVPMAYFENMVNWPREVYGLRLLRGAETDINDWRGRIYLQRRYMKNLDYLIASAHTSSLRGGADRATVTRMWMGIAEDEAVDIIGHCGRDHHLFGFEEEPVIRAFKAGGKTVELNDCSFWKGPNAEACTRICELCGKYDVPVMIGSDAHYATAVGSASKALETVVKVGLPERLVINADVGRLESWITDARQKKKRLCEKY